jgi:hypothetical protein
MARLDPARCSAELSPGVSGRSDVAGTIAILHYRRPVNTTGLAAAIERICKPKGCV